MTTRQAVDEKDHVEALLHRAGLPGPLVAHRQPVLAGMDGIHQPHGHMLAVGAEGHGLFAPQPGGEVLVGPHQAVGLDGEDAGAQVVDHLVGTVGLGGDVGVEPDERLAHPRLHHHIAGLAGELCGGEIVPVGVSGRPPGAARSLGHFAAEGVFPAGPLFLPRRRFAAALRGDRVEDHLFDRVGFGKRHSLTSQSLSYADSGMYSLYLNHDLPSIVRF